MSAFLYGTCLQWKAALRSRNVLVVFYVVPLLYFAVFSSVFTSVLPDGETVLLPMMSVFAVSMAALIGVPPAVQELYRSDVRGIFAVNGVPLWQGLVQILLADFLHLLILSVLIGILAPVCFDAAMPQNFAAYAAGLLLLIAASLSIAGVIGLAVRNEATASAFSIAFFLPSILLSGIMFPAAMLPEGLVDIGGIFPATWSFQLMCSSAIVWADVWPLLLILAASAAASVLLLWRLRRR
ncbi:MAG: ABC transporter permease [Clostridia bacterium]|nr:ABC transporter permease [Clostridia bacterium]